MGFSLFALTPFTDEQLEGLINRWHTDEPDLAEEFLARFASSTAAQLIRTPLLATIALVLYRHGPDDRQTYGRPAMYQEFVTYLLSGREGERGRQEILHRAVSDAGGSASLADWLPRCRVQLLTYLAERTLAGDDRMKDHATAWIKRHTPEPVDFLHDWQQIVNTLLAGTGLLVQGRDLDDFQWLHRSFAEYLAARNAAAILPDDWPGQELDEDPIVKAALLDTDGGVALLTAAVWANRPEAAIEGFVDALLRRSGGYRVYGQKPTSFVRIGNDTNEPDHYAALAGRLVAEGTPVSDSAEREVLNRLVDRASSMFHGREFTTILSAQPHRELARALLERIALDSHQSIQARAGAVVAIARTFGWAAAVSTAGSLLQPAGSAQWIRPGADGGIHVVYVQDARVIAAEQLSTLGPVACELVDEILQAVDLRLAKGADYVVAAEALLALGQASQAIEVVQSAQPGDSAVDLTVSVLLRAGDTAGAKYLVDQLLACLDDNNMSTLPTLRSIAMETTNHGASSLAQAIATAVLDRQQEQTPAWAYSTLAQLGDTWAAAARISEHGGPPEDWGWHEWADVVRALHHHGRPDAARDAISALLEHTVLDGFANDVIGALLTEFGDDRGPEFHLSAAFDEECPISIRVHSAKVLLDTPHYESAVEALRHIARGPLDNDRGSTDLAAALVRLGHVKEAIELLSREVTNTVTRRDDYYWSTIRTDAIEALDIIAPSVGRALLVQLMDAGAVATCACVDVAKAFERMGDADRSLTLARRFVEEHSPSENLTAFGNAVSPRVRSIPHALVDVARVLYRLDDQQTTVEACRRAVWWATAETTSLDSVVAAVAYLDEVDQLGPDETAKVRTICVNILQDLEGSLSHEADNVVKLIQIIARHS